MRFPYRYLLYISFQINIRYGASSISCTARVPIDISTMQNVFIYFYINAQCILCWTVHDICSIVVELCPFRKLEIRKEWPEMVAHCTHDTKT